MSRADSGPAGAALRWRLPALLFWLLAVVVFGFAIWPHPLLAAPDKAQHIAAFVVLTFAASLAYRNQPGWRIAAALCGFGGFIELVQMIPELHRQADLLDWLADSAAIVATLAVARGLRRR